MTTYTDEEVQILLKAQEDRLKVMHFEEKTREILTEINRRLNEANGYKNTIGKNVVEIKARLESLEKARQEDVESAKKDFEARTSKHNWWQDWYIRIGILFAIVYELVSIAHGLGIMK